MTLFIERIEIRQQPEHKRYWAEVEARVDAGFRRHVLTTPYADGRDGMLAALKAYWDELDPSLPPDDPVKQMIRVMDNGIADGLVGLGAAVPAGNANLDALRAEAEDAGVRVDGRWGEARLRQEIAAAHDEAAPSSE